MTMTEPTTEPTTAARTYVAEFPKASFAVTFAARLADGRDYADNVVHTGRTVTWTSTYTDTSPHYYESYEWCMREVVGAYGSTVSRKAQLNGKPCPASF